MKDLWVLSIQTSLPNPCRNHEDLHKTLLVFDNFEKARVALRREVHKLAFSKNAMFDGTGRLNVLKNYWSYKEEIDEDDYEDDFLGPKTLDEMQDMLLSVFKGENNWFLVEHDVFEDSFIGVEITPGTIRFFGVDDGPCNGYDPVLCTNMLDTRKEQDYYLYIMDAFGQEEYSSELYVDLKKVKFDE